MIVAPQEPPSDRTDRFDVKQVRRYYDPQYKAMIIKVLPGEHYVTTIAGEMLVTVLGSCISACIRDPFTGIGGMNHFMLPESKGSDWGSDAASLRYGNFAMETLINDILKAGGRRERLEVKVFGGGNVLVNSTSIGHDNADFIESYLAAEKLPITAKHLRGTKPRRIHYLPRTGKVMMQVLQTDTSLLGREEKYKGKLQQAPIEGSAELFV